MVLTSSAQEYNKDEIIAAFLINFCKFTQKNDTLGVEAENVHFHILGNSQVANALKALIESKSHGKAKITVAQDEVISQKENDFIVLFIDSSKSDQISKLMQNVQNRSILTVSDASNALENGILIELFEFNKYVRFRINHSKAKKQGLVFNSKLLKLATSVE